MEQLIATLMAGFLTRGASGEVMQADWQKRALDASFSLAKQIHERSNATMTAPAPSRLTPKEDHQHERASSRQLARKPVEGDVTAGSGPLGATLGSAG